MGLRRGDGGRASPPSSTPSVAGDYCLSSAYSCDLLPNWKPRQKKDTQSQHLTLSLSAQPLSTRSPFVHASSWAGACRAGKRQRRAEEFGSQGWQPVVTWFFGVPNTGKGTLKGAALQESRRRALAQPRKSSSAGESRRQRGPEIDAWAVQPPLSIPKHCQIRGLNSSLAVKPELRGLQSAVTPESGLTSWGDAS